MKSKFIKIFTLAISALLLMGCFIGFSISAEETVEPNVEIVFNNLEYGDNISILYATKVTGVTPDAMKMNFYAKNEEGEYALVYATEEYYVDNVTVNGNTDAYNIFKSPGIAPKFMPEIIYAQLIVSADGAEYASNMSRFSVVEYCYKRLYKDTGITDDQKDLYNHVIGYGTAAQKVLNYNTDDTPAHYFYVNAEGAVVDTVEIDGETYSFSAGIFKPGASAVLSYQGAVEDCYYAEWDISYKTADGALVTDVLENNGTITVADKHIIANSAVRFGSDNFDKGATSPFITTTPTADSTLSVSVADAPAAKYEGDKALKITPLGTGITRIDLMNGEEGDCYVFEADVYYATQSVYGTFANFNFKNENDVTINTTSYGHQNGSEGTRYWRMMANSGGTNNYAYFGALDFADEWSNYRIELYYTGGSWRVQYFYNDVFIFEDLSSSKKTDGTALSYLEISHSAKDYTYYFDNVRFVRTNKAYSSTPETAAPTISGTTGTGVYFNSVAQNTSGYKIVDFDLDFVQNGNGRYNDDDTGPRPTSYKNSINAYNANGYGLLMKETAENHGAIKYAIPGSKTDKTKAQKTIIEMDLAVSSPSISLPIVISSIVDELSGDIYFGYDAASGQMYITDFSRKVAYFNLNEWHNFRFEITRVATLDESGKVTAIAATIDVYMDGQLEGSVNALDAKYRSGYSNQMNIQLRNTDATVKFSYDNLVLTTKEAD